MIARNRTASRAGAAVLASLLVVAGVGRAADTSEAGPASAAAAPVPAVLTLADALALAARAQPSVAIARANSDAAAARVDRARAPLWPQLTGEAGYERTTANFTSRPGSLPRSTSSGRSTTPTFDTFDYWSFDVRASQLLYDFGQTTGKRDAAEASLDAERANERSTDVDVARDVRNAYFAARAALDLVTVARDTLANQARHLEQISAFVEVGTRPEIDLAQARTDHANARVSLIEAENSWDTAKAELRRAIGITDDAPFEVGDDEMPPVDAEDASTDVLLATAKATRPDLHTLAARLRSQELEVGSVRGGYAPTLEATSTLSDAGTRIDDTTWNWDAGVALSWPLFEGGATRAAEREALANVAVAQGELETLEQQIRLEVEQARLGVRGAKSSIAAAGEVVVNAREQLRLAEGRYETGVGNVIELGDAEVALSSARAQEVQARYRLASARADLLRALGRR